MHKLSAPFKIFFGDIFIKKNNLKMYMYLVLQSIRTQCVSLILFAMKDVLNLKKKNFHSLNVKTSWRLDAQKPGLKFALL